MNIVMSLNIKIMLELFDAFGGRRYRKHDWVQYGEAVQVINYEP